MAISPDRPEKVREILEKADVDYGLLSDSDLAVASALGVAYRAEGIPDGFKKLLEDASGRDHRLLPVPSVFILDTKGTVEFAYVDPDYKRRIDPDVLLAAAKAAAEARK